MITLHPFQRGIADDIERAVASGKRRILVVLPTGGGKTIIAAEQFRRAKERHQAALFLAHRREIITQTSQRLTEHGMPLGVHGIIMAERVHELRPLAPIQVASIDTLHVRGIRNRSMELPRADVVAFDEAHRVRGRTRENLVKQYPNAILLGFTATPCRGDGKGLGDVFEMMIAGPQVAELTTLGFLVPTNVFAPIYRDIAKGVGTANGDYIVRQLSQRMNTVELVGDVVRDWLTHGERRRSVVFCVDVAHSVHVRDAFLHAGVRAEHLSGETPVAEREAILARLASGETEVVSNCMVLTEGWDCPPVSCCVLARPTKQLGLYRQMVGRILRPFEGKADAVILDHAGAVYRHGLPSDDIAWGLEVDRKARNVTAAARAEGATHEIARCPECDAILGGPPPCWSCGWQPQRRGRDVEFVDGELGLVVGGKANAPIYNEAEKERWQAMLRYIALERGYNPGWVGHYFKQKFGHWPTRRYPDPIEPAPEVRSWVRSRLIAYAKRRGTAA
jgi:superfamily II DNA or RNA helicase